MKYKMKSNLDRSEPQSCRRTIRHSKIPPSIARKGDKESVFGRKILCVNAFGVHEVPKANCAIVAKRKTALSRRMHRQPQHSLLVSVQLCQQCPVFCAPNTDLSVQRSSQSKKYQKNIKKY